MNVEELLKELNNLVGQDPSILKLKLCAKDNEFKRLFKTFRKVLIIDHDWNKCLFSDHNVSRIEKVLVLD
jgi:hypothetical protein